jgi:hypothetical protein
MKNKEVGIYFIILFSLSSVRFFYPWIININKVYYTYFIIFFAAVFFIILNYKRSDNNTFTVPVFLLLIAALISGFSATIFWDQNIIDSLKVLIFFMSYIFFFLLASLKARVQDIEKVIIILAVLYIIIYSISYYSYPRQIFGTIMWGDDRGGFPRIIIPGAGFLFLFSFYALSKYYNKHKFLWLVIFIITLVFIIMILTRTLIAISFIFLALFALHKSKNMNKIIAVLFIAIGFFVISQMNFFKSLSNQTISQTSNIKNDIRIKAADFYLNHFSPNTFTKIFGNGEPYPDSSYGDYMWHLEAEERLFLSDIGYIGLYTKFGLLAILAYIIIIIKTIKLAVPEEYLYLKYFLYFVFIISIILSSTFSTDFIIPIVLALFTISSNDLSLPEVDETS